ncbi:MAG: MMPL family transporter [Planctomycetes bacterium]|nr:MMPL family transporter [Planctomycetota bacterium]
MPTLSERLSRFLIDWRWLLLGLAIVLAAAAYLPSRQVAFDRSIENMFAEADPLLAPYGNLKRVFGGNEVAMVVYRDEDLLDPDGAGLDRLEDVSRRVEQVPGVKGVLSLDRLMDEEIVDPDSKLAQAQREVFENFTHNEEGDIAAIVTMLVPQEETEVPRRQTILDLRRIAESLPSGMIAGEPVMVSDGFEYVEEDGRRLGLWSTALLALVIVLCFRSLRWVLIPVAVVQLALLLTRAFLAWGGLRLSMVSSMLTAIVTVIGVATVVHVIVRFREGRDAGRPPREALLWCGMILAAPVFWACATDAMGFASLRLARVGPVQDFGVMMAIGALMVLAAVPLVVPGAALAGKRDVDPKRAWGEGILERRLQGLVHAAERRPYLLGVTSLVLAAVVSAGAMRLEVESDFTKNFREGSPIVESYQFIESNLGGAGVWDVVLPAEEQLTWDYLERVLRLEERLRREVVIEAEGASSPGLTKVISLADAVQAASASSPFALEDMPGFLRNRLISGGLGAMRRRMPVFYDALYSADPAQPEQHYFRIMLRAAERQPSEQKRELIAQVERIAREEFPKAETTGFFVLLTHLIDSMIQDQWRTFAVATAAIFVMMLVAFRSPTLAIISLVPNLAPILMVMGGMGWLAGYGVKINMGAAMIAAVSIGLSIDSSIHYVITFRRARDAGKSVAEALETTQGSVGLAATFATLALVVGFSVLGTSNFVPTIYFGVLVSVAMFGALAGNLLVLPILLKLAARERSAAFSAGEAPRGEPK